MAIKRVFILFIISFSFFNKGAAQMNMILDNTLQNAPEIGLLVANVGLPITVVKVVKDTLATKSIRFAIEASRWSGFSNSYDLYVTDSGLIPHIVLGVDSAGVAPQPWIDNYAGLITIVDDILDTYPDIHLLILDNEEMIPAYHTGDIAGYIAIAEAIKPTLQAHHCLLANGGFGDIFAQNCYTYRYVQTKYNQDSADAYGIRVFLTLGQRNACKIPDSDPDLEARVLQVDSVMSCTAFDIANIHSYEPQPPVGTGTNTVTQPTTNEWRFQIEAFKNSTTKRRIVFNNETGQRHNEEPDLVTNMLILGFRLGFKWMDWWSGNGAGLGARPLTQDSGTLKPTGDAWKAWQQDTYWSGFP
jgi:hypothetical protein